MRPGCGRVPDMAEPRQARAQGERGIKILAPITYRSRPDAADEGEDQDRPRELRGFRVENVWDVSQTDGEPLPEVASARLEGDGPAGL